MKPKLLSRPNRRIPKTLRRRLKRNWARFKRWAAR